MRFLHFCASRFKVSPFLLFLSLYSDKRSVGLSSRHVAHSVISEIHQKFDELEWIQRARINEGTMAQDPSHRWALEDGPEVKARNRYLNVQAWANSRIHLRVADGKCDFINASPIVLRDSLSQEERRYIATQVSAGVPL